MKLLVDMNLSPLWIQALEQSGVEAVHWSSIGNPSTSDREIFEYARENGLVVFTHDLDFGTILAATGAVSPSVIQVRAQDILPSALASRLVKVLQLYQTVLETGAILVVDEARERIRILPLRISS